MLIEFSVANFRSIKELVTLSLVKAKGQELENTNTFSTNAPNTPILLRSMAIYGANAAGKSNVIKAIEFVENFVINSSSKNQAGKSIEVAPFLLDDDTNNEPSEFELSFISENVRYQYGFSITKERVMEEWLFAYPEGRPQQLIDRSYNVKEKSYTWGNTSKLTGKKKVWQEATRENALFLSTAIQLNNKQLLPVFKWFLESLQVAGFGSWSPSFSMELCDNNDSKLKILDFLKAADVDIDDIELEKENFEINKLPLELSNEFKKEIQQKFKDKPVLNLKTVHKLKSGKSVHFNLNDESDGTQKIFALSGPWLDTLENGITLIIDELHDNLHPLMVKFLVQLFHSKKTNPKNAQLIFTTHDTSILNQEVFRRDQIWFCEKDNKQVTNLYPLTDFSPRKGVDNLEKGYLSGRYGALPYLKNITTAMGCN